MLVESNPGSRINPRNQINPEERFNPDSQINLESRINCLIRINSPIQPTFKIPLKRIAGWSFFVPAVQFLRSVQLLRRCKLTSQQVNIFAPEGQSLRSVRCSKKVRTYTPAEKFLHSVESVRRINLAPRGNNSEVRAE